MDIKFERFSLQANFHSPLKGFEPVFVPTEVRIDPLTKRHSRIISWVFPSRERSDFSKIAEESKGCFFCPENVFVKTPRFLKEIIPEGRVQIGKAVGFPNLNPIGTYGSVIVLCNEHFLPLHQLTPEIYIEGISVAVEIIRRTMAFDPKARFWQINQNFLFPAGSSILHPHIQVIGDPIPTNEMELLLNNSSPYHRKNRSVYWTDLVEIEKQRGERYISSSGSLHWLASFAPLGSNEVCGIADGHGSITTLTSEEISSLARGIISTLKYYDEKNLNSFNFSIASIFGEPSHRFFIRIISRTPMQPYYPNDSTSFKVLHSEMTSNILPEELCRQIRPYFKIFFPC